MNYYEILDVDKKATLLEIKRAFKKLAQQHHPDKGGNPATFAAIREAYKVLSDPIARHHYDTTGSAEFTNTRSLANEWLAKNFDQWLRANIENTDKNPIHEVTARLNSELEDAVKGIAKLKGQRKKLNKHIKNVKRKQDGDNLFAASVNELLKEADNGIAKAEQLKRVLKLVKIILENYEYTGAVTMWELDYIPVGMFSTSST